MMKKMAAALLAIGLLATLLAGCTGNTDFERESSSVVMVPASSEVVSSSEPEPVPEPVVATPGEITGNTYTNDSLGILMELPEGWYQMGADELQGMLDATSQSGSSSDESLTDKGLVPLFWISEFDPAANDTSNANMSFSAENVGIVTGIESQVMGDYITALQKMYQSMKNVDGTEVRFTVRGPEAMDINGTEFQKMTATMSNTVGTHMMTRDIYLCLDKGYVLNLTATYYDDGQKAMIDESVQSLSITDV